MAILRKSLEMYRLKWNPLRSTNYLRAADSDSITSASYEQI